MYNPASGSATPRHRVKKLGPQERRWTQVTHRDGSKGKWRSEESRQRDRARVAAWKKAHKARALEINRKAFQAWYAKNATRFQLRRLSQQEVRELYEAGMSIVGKRSPLIYKDKHGRILAEDELSAEQLIRRYHEERERRST